MIENIELLKVKEKLLWAVSSKEFSVMIKPAEAALLLREIWELEEPTGTVDERQIRLEVCDHDWGEVEGMPHWDASQCRKCGLIKTNAEVARMRYHRDDDGS